MFFNHFTGDFLQKKLNRICFLSDVIFDDRNYWGVFMGKLKKVSFILMFQTLCSLCFAKQLCFQIVQHDDAAKGVTEQSYIIEDEVLNRFFDYGFIVTNSDSTVSSSQSQDDSLFTKGIKDAFNGYSDIFIQIKLFYERTEQNTSENSELKNIDFLVANAKTGTKIAENSLKNIKLEHKKDDLKKISSNLTAEINKVLNNK